MLPALVMNYPSGKPESQTGPTQRDREPEVTHRSVHSPSRTQAPLLVLSSGWSLSHPGRSHSSRWE